MIFKTESGRVGYRKKYRVAGRVRVPVGHWRHALQILRSPKKSFGQGVFQISRCVSSSPEMAHKTVCSQTVFKLNLVFFVRNRGCSFQYMSYSPSLGICSLEGGALEVDGGAALKGGSGVRRCSGIQCNIINDWMQ